MVVSQAPGNIFLFGEHAVVYSQPTIIASVNLRAQCQVEKTSRSHIRILSHKLGWALLINYKKTGNEDMFVLLDLCQELLHKNQIKGGLEVTIESQIPPEGGLSSSTAVLCSILSSFSKLFQINISKNHYYNHLYGFQQRIHGGRGSGVEIISSSMGGFNYITFTNGDIRVKKLSALPLKIVIGNTGIKKDSPDTLEHIPNLMQQNLQLVTQSFNQIGSISHQALEVIEAQDIAKIGSLLNKNQEILASLELSHPKIDLAVEKALKAGAYGAKLSGRGQGGIMFALVDNQNKDKVAQAIEQAGLTTIETEIGVEGVQ